MNLLDLFSGIGGFHLGLEQAGFEFDWVGFSEIDQYANKQYKRRFPDAEQLGDIKSIRPERLPDIDLVTFGFPCQDLSIAGKRGGLQANRSSLFFEAMRIIGAKKPKYFIFENVKGLFSSNKGQDFDLILRTISDFGYDGGWQLLNTRWFLPQNRERVYFVGHIRGEPRPEVFPIGEDDKRTNEGVGEAQVAGSLTGGGHSGGMHSNMTMIKEEFKPLDPNDIAKTIRSGGRGSKTNKHNWDLIKVADYRTDEGIRIREEGDAPCLTASHHSENEPSRMQGLVISHNLQQRSPDRPSKKAGQPGGSGPLSKEDGTTYCLEGSNLQAVEVKAVLTPDRAEKRQNGRRFKDDGEDMFTLTSQDQHGVMEGSNIRRLTPTECERLQGFPDGWTEGQSDTQRYKQLGNAVSVPVVKAVGEKLFKCLG